MADEKSRSSYAAWYERNKEKARSQKREVMRRLRQENPEKYNEQSRKAKVREKLKLFAMYGRECSMCGFKDMRALSLDYKNNNGNAERKELGVRGTYRRAKEQYRPDEYQILCMNCQFIKRAKHSNHIDLNIEWRQQHSIFYQEASDEHLQPHPNQHSRSAAIHSRANALLHGPDSGIARITGKDNAAKAQRLD